MLDILAEQTATDTNDASYIDTSSNSEKNVLFLSPSSINATSFPNTRRDTGKLPPHLVEAIRSEGVNQNVIARELEDGTLQLIAGFTRHRIATMLNLDKIPCVIIKVSDSIAMKIHLEENACRVNLSIIDQARASAQYMAVCEGDKKEAASRLGWSTKMLNDRIQLNRCTDDVLHAVDDFAFFTLSHAIILSSFADAIQNKTLQTILAEKWTVETLLDKAVARNRPLSTAKFDKTECENCPHNTIHQKDMFSTGLDSDATCANLKCFKEKNLNWLSTAKEKASERYGKVLFWFEANESDRNTISATVVGETQMDTCGTCSSNVAIMDDRQGSEGNILSNQCVDKACFSKCSTAYKKVINTPITTQSVSTAISNNADTSLPQSVKDAHPSAKKEKVKTEVFNLAKPSTATEKLEQETLSATTFAEIKSNENLTMAYLLAQVADRQNATFTGKESEIGTTISNLITRTPEQLASLADKLVQGLLGKNNGAKGEPTTPVHILLETVKGLPNGDDIAVRAWTPTDAILKSYTIAGITAICKGSGFINEFNRDEENIEKKMTFSTLSKGGKDKFVEQILAYEFDWTSYAPASMKAKGE